MNVQEFGDSIKAKYPQYQNIDSVELGNKMLQKYPEYQSRITNNDSDAVTSPKKPSQQVAEGIDNTIGQIPGIGGFLAGATKLAATPATWAADVGTDIGNTAAEGVRTAIGGGYRIAQSFDPSNSETAQQRVTRGVGGLFDVIGGGLQTGFSPAAGVFGNTPGLKQIGDTATWATNSLAGTGSFIFKRSLGIDDKSEEGQQIDKGFQLLGQLIPMKYGEAKLRQKQGIAPSLMDKAALKTGELGKNATKGTLNFMGNTATQALSKLQGLEPSTLKQAFKDPEAFSGKNRQTTSFDLATKFKSALDERLDHLSELGKGYGEIRDSGIAVQIPKDWMQNQFSKWKLKIDEEGQLFADSKSLIRDKKSIAALQELYNRYGNKEILGADEFLNFRSDISELSKFSQEAQLPEVASRQMRHDLNGLRSQVPGLKELDDKFSPEVKLLKDIKKKIENPDGSLKDNATSYIKSVTNEGRQGRLNLLSKVMSSIGEDVNNMKGILDIENAKGSKVGTYAKGALLGGGAFMIGGVPGIIASTLLTNPELGVQFYRALGKSKAAISSAFNASKDYLINQSKTYFSKQGMGENVVDTSQLNKSVESNKLTSMSKNKVDTVQYTKAFSDELGNVDAMIKEKSKGGNISINDTYDIINRVLNLDENHNGYHIEVKKAIASNLMTYIDKTTNGLSKQVMSSILDDIANKSSQGIEQTIQEYPKLLPAPKQNSAYPTAQNTLKSKSSYDSNKNIIELYTGQTKDWEPRLPNNNPELTDSLMYGRGIYLSPDIEIAKGYSQGGGIVYKTKVEIKNPLRPGMKDWQQFIQKSNGESKLKFLISRGYDAVVDTKGKYKQVMIVSPDQIKEKINHK